MGTDGGDGGPGSENHPVADKDRKLLAGGSPLDCGQGLTVGLCPRDSRKAPWILGGLGPDTALGLKGLSLSLHQGPPLRYTTGRASGPKAQREAKRPPKREDEGAREGSAGVSPARQLGLRQRAGQWHPCTLGLECGTGMSQ